MGKNFPRAAVACGHHAGCFTCFNSLKLHNNPHYNFTNEETLRSVKTQFHLFAPLPHIIFEMICCGRATARVCDRGALWLLIPLREVRIPVS